MDEEIISNRFVRVFNEWICIHDENFHFPEKLYPSHRPATKLCDSTLRIRGNDSFTRLPIPLRQAMVVHEIGHREMGHASIPQDNPFFRLGCVLKGSIDKRESEADRYACKIMPRQEYIAALESMVKMHKSSDDPPSWSTTEELKRRIRKLRDESQVQH